MWNCIENILSCFRTSFSRKKAYGWFVTIILGLMTRVDKLGLSSVIRSMSLHPRVYESMLHFFRANSWSLDDVMEQWHKVVSGHSPVFCIFSRHILIGDGVKQTKEGHYMPGVKRMAQESGTQSKPGLAHGHMWGCIGILTGTIKNLTCTPLSMRIHDGLQATLGWDGAVASCASHVVQIIRDGCKVAQRFGTSYLLLDRYFLSVPALTELASQNEKNTHQVDIITRAKSSVVAYEIPDQKPAGTRGRPRKKGARVKLMDLFQERAGYFMPMTVTLYGKKQDIRYYDTTLLWGQGLYQKLRFVLVQRGDAKTILVSTDLTLSPTSIIHLYCHRFRVEFTFRSLKQDIGGFAYHFWTKAMGKLSHFKKKREPDPLDAAAQESERKRVLDTVRATEMYALMSSIAIGILQILSETCRDDPCMEKLRYQRTKAKARPSEANVMYILQRHLFAFLEKHAKDEIPSLIRGFQSDGSGHKNKESA